MTSEQYTRWSAPLRAHPAATAALLGANRCLTLLCYVLYPLLLVLLLMQGSPLFLRCLLTAGISFCALSAFRKVYNAPRPYEALDITPLIRKDTRGKSFPSRHVFSVAVIAMCWLAYQPPVGIAMLLVCVLMAFIRVLGGIHYPRDVIAGAAVGILSGLIGLYWL